MGCRGMFQHLSWALSWHGVMVNDVTDFLVGVYVTLWRHYFNVVTNFYHDPKLTSPPQRCHNFMVTLRTVVVEIK